VLKVVVVLLMVGGCSFATMRSPHGPGQPECEDGYVYPVIDVVAAIAAPFVVYQLAKQSNTTQSGEVQDDLGPALATFFIGMPIMGVIGTSAIFGFIKRDRCERMKRDYVQLVTPPPTLVPAPPPYYGPAPAPYPAQPPPAQ
jgi:hypothetical protein